MKEVPLLFITIPDRITSAICEEKEAIDDYAGLENVLRRAGLNSQGDIVHEIRNDELDHRMKFVAMSKILGLEEAMG